jgi:hypothetical protein
VPGPLHIAGAYCSSSHTLYNYSGVLFGKSMHNVPQSHENVLNHAEREEWVAAKKKELDQLSRLKVAQLVPLP